MTLEGPKWLAMGSKWAHFTCLGTPNGLVSIQFRAHLIHPQPPTFGGSHPLQLP